MNYELPDEPSEPQVSRSTQPSDLSRDQKPAGTVAPMDGFTRQPATAPARDDAPRDQEAKSNPKDSPPKDSSPKSVTVVVRGETKDPQSKETETKDNQSKDKDKQQKKVSEAKVKMQSRLPALDDDGDVGVQKEQIVTRDGKPDLAFTGTLVASAAPQSAPQGKWQEYRVYETSGGKHVFSKVTRSIYAEDQGNHEAEIFDPAPASMPTQLLRSARDLVHSQPLTWKDAASDFFGYDPLAKVLYRKLSEQFEEHIS
jgi:hypothetical protein